MVSRATPPLRHASRRWVAAVAAVGLTAALLTAGATVPAVADTDEDLASRWTLATLPDTQFYSRYGRDVFQPRYGSNPYQVQAEWLVDVQDDLNIPLVAHVGDIVDRSNQTYEWTTASAAHKALEDGGLPYSISTGNHDVTNPGAYDTELTNQPFLTHFPPARSQAQSPDTGRDPSGFSEYHVFEAEGQKYLLLALAWRASDATLAWADQVLANHPTLPAILTSHDILGVASDGTTALSTPNGDRLWNELIRSNDQIFLTVSGHNHGTAHRTLTNDFGHPVHQVLQDLQMYYEGGDGYLGLFEFDLEHDRINVSMPSPWVAWKPQTTLIEYDQPFLEAANQQYSLPIDFTERFAGFHPAWKPGDGQLPSLTQRARDIILDGFAGPSPVVNELPGDVEDYVRVEGTAAHWRPHLSETDEGEVLPENGVVPDVVSGQHMRRATIAESGSPAAQVSDVTIQKGHAFSSDGLGVCFADSTRVAPQRFSYLTTGNGVPVTNVDLSRGYTIETFVRLDAEWTADANAWTRALARTGNRSRFPGLPRITDYTAAPASIGFSNLREFQWTVVPQNPTVGDRQAWSGEITSSEWYHLAIVNDPADGANGTTRMFVNGMPILRDITQANSNGMSFEQGLAWTIGAGMSGDVMGSGWHGCVGETRIIDRPTTEEQWLIHRPDVSDFTAATVDFDLDPGEQLAALSGTGQPGATVVAEGAVTGEAVVAEDGTWTMEGTFAGERGTNAFTLTHGFGGRRSEPMAGEVFVPHPSFATVRGLLDEAESDGTLTGRALIEVRKHVDQAEKLASGHASSNAVVAQLENATRKSGLPADANVVKELAALADAS